MADEQLPFADVRLLELGAFSIPELKWRELLFIGAIRAEGSFFVRDPSRPMPPFQVEDLFPLGVRLGVELVDGRAVIRREAIHPTGPGL